MDKTNIGIIDDSKLTIRNLSEYLEITNRVNVVIKARSGKEFLAKMNSLDKDFHPKVVLTDIDMPEMNGIETVLIAKGRYPTIHFLMLTIYDDEDLIFNAIKAGACGYLLKDEKVNIIIEHIEKLIYNRHVPMSPTIAQKTLDLLRKSENVVRPTPDSIPKLSHREIQVLNHLVDGLDYKKIAEILYLSSNTIKKHISNIYSKLHVSCKAEAIKMSHYYNLID